ncbi:MAG: DUF2231 domain-containing protein [Myxococcota bacterium]
MFELPLHPKIVHIPIALAVLMPLVSIGLLVAWWRDWLPARTWTVAVALQAILVTSAVVAMETGEDEEHQVEEVLASEQPLEEHEEAAEIFTYAAGATLGLMFLPLVIPGAGRKKVIATVAVAGTVAVFVLGYQVGEAGGDLVYEHGAAEAWTQPAAGGDELRYEEHDDD